MDQKLHPNVIKYWQFYQMLFMARKIGISAIPLVAYLLWLKTWDVLLFCSIAAIAYYFVRGMLFILIGVNYKYERRSYRLTEDELVINWGNFWRESSTVIPISRVQYVDKEQDRIGKRLGISELCITTAGDDSIIVGLPEEDAEKLRRQIIQLAKREDTHVYYD
ncbi:PH domain-containing protein [Paenibacillus luteus]|uniref:PH domain-containing protein n=1 Tax=Paenibacillus luteus TaxID=2545753 RepID=UPI00137574E7|nr:PH domain-containing protein [Paenibacillus luteus]